MKKILTICILYTLFINNGCKDFVEVGPPSNKVIAETVFQSDATATAAINGLYAKMTFTGLYFASGGTTAYLGTYADELFYTSTGTSNLQFNDSVLATNNAVVNYNFWGPAYQLIYATNSAIAGLKDATITETLRTQLIGEAYFMRAYYYWALVSLYGDVPLVLTVDDYAKTVQMKRTPATEVVKQILTDLNEAKTRLKSEYPSSGRFRPNYYTAIAMLSRIHTYLGNWTDVLVTSNEVIAHSMYDIETDLNKVFLIGSKEAIWQMTYSQTLTNTFEGSNFIPTTAATTRPLFAIQNTLYNAFTTIDKRKTNWIATKTVSGTVYPYPFKYKVRSNATKTEAQMMIRLAEIYLNRAEAKAHLNDVTSIDDLNKTRNRAGLSNLSGLTGQPLLNAIHDERRLELFAEWGLRFFDLRRTGKLDAVNSALKPNWVSTGALFPIPNTEIQAAPNLEQNPGYN